MKIAIIDYELGNIMSVKNAFERIGAQAILTADKLEIKKCDFLVLPGVGAAADAMRIIKKRGLDKILRNEIKNKKRILGICLGMQILMDFSEEGDVDCLGFIKGTVKRFNTKMVKIPQIGWNMVEKQGDSILFKGFQPQEYFYFVNSYYCEPENKKFISGISKYPDEYCVSVEAENIFGVQFHPEKSGETGLNLLKNWLDLKK